MRAPWAVVIIFEKVTESGQEADDTFPQRVNSEITQFETVVVGIFASLEGVPGGKKPSEYGLGA